MNKYYATLPRLPYDKVWEKSAHYDSQERQMIEQAMDEVARKAGLRLCNRVPWAGWEACTHNPHGSYQPCGEMMQGARSVWVWAAR